MKVMYLDFWMIFNWQLIHKLEPASFEVMYLHGVRIVYQAEINEWQ